MNGRTRKRSVTDGNHSTAKCGATRPLANPARRSFEGSGTDYPNLEHQSMCDQHVES